MVVDGMSLGWWGFESAGGAMGDTAKVERLQWKNEGTADPISTDDAVELAHEVPSPLVRTPTTYPPHA